MKKRNILFSSLLITSFCIIFINISDGYIINEKNEKEISSYFNTEKKEQKETYLGIIELPTISIKRGFYSYSSKENTVEKNIEVITPNCFPNEECAFILASHSGTSNISFFKNLDKLNINDKAILYYQNNEVTYYLERKVSVPKNGYLTISKSNKRKLILTTCNKIDDTLQDIYYFH